MNSTATFEIAPFGASYEGEADEFGRRFVVERRVSAPFARHVGPRLGNRFAARAGVRRFPHGFGPGFGRPVGFGRRFGLAGPRFPGRFGHGLFAHRFARDFRQRLGLHRPFGLVRGPSFAVGGPIFAGGPTFDAGAPDAPPPPLSSPLGTATQPPMQRACRRTAGPTGSTPGSEVQIRWMQFSLNSVLGTTLPTDGIPSPELRAALQTFQTQQGLPVSGFAGPDTVAALQAAAAGQGAAGGVGGSQPDASPAAGGDASAGGEFEIMPAFGTPESWRMRHARF